MEESLFYRFIIFILFHYSIPMVMNMHKHKYSDQYFLFFPREIFYEIETNVEEESST